MKRTNTAPFADDFRSFLPLPAALDPPLEEALRHVLDNPGSLVRPRTIDRAATAYGMDAEDARELAIALEYFHSASLVFDDLPCMDDARERRGLPCVHLAFGEAGAILTALALITRAYALIWRAVSGCPQHLQRSGLAYIEQCLGLAGILNGQSLDLHYSTLSHTRETTDTIARGKTVSLIRLTLVLPAMLGGASRREIQILERISLFWGLAYQMTDDLKDLLGNPAETGKTSARDALLDRPNAAAVLGISAAEVRIARCIHLGHRALVSLLKYRPRMFFLEELRSSLQDELARLAGSACRQASGACA